jgi:hypothetical protein
MPFSRCRSKRSNPKVDLPMEATVVACILKVRDSSIWVPRYLILQLGGIVLLLMIRGAGGWKDQSSCPYWYMGGSGGGPI